MNTKTKLISAAAIFGALSSTAALGAVNDWEDPSVSDEPATNAEKPMNLSVEFFYAASMDEYAEGVSDTKVNLFGDAFLLNRQISFQNSPVAFDVGLLAILDYGYSDYSDYYYTGYYYSKVELTQFDFMVGPQFGVRFLPAEAVSFGLGAQLGIDYRYGKVEETGYRDATESKLGTFLGFYANMKIDLSEICDLSLTYRLMQTNVDFEDDLKGAEKDIGYHMFAIGVNFKF